MITGCIFTATGIVIIQYAERVYRQINDYIKSPYVTLEEKGSDETRGMP